MCYEGKVRVMWELCVCVCSERKVCVLRDTGVLWRGSACVFCRGTGVL